MNIAELFRRIRFLMARSRHDAELGEEMRLHRELREQRLREQGSPDAASSAQRRFGNATRFKEDSGELWSWRWLDDLAHDLRYALRQVRSAPWFTAVVVLTLGLGIGANTAIFSAMNSMLLRYPPFEAPEQVLYLRTTALPDEAGQTGQNGSTFSIDVYNGLRARQDAFQDVIAFVPLGQGKTPVRIGTEPEEANVDMVSGNFFPALGVAWSCGRAFDPQDETRHAQVAVLRHGYAVARFGEPCGALGQNIEVRGVPFQIVGVAGQGFLGVESSISTDVWVPLQDRPELNAWGSSRPQTFYESRNWWSIMLMARLADGLTAEQAMERANPAFQQAAYEFRGGISNSDMPPSLTAEPARGIAGMRDSRGPLQVLMTMVGVVLLIACGNVSLLLVARNGRRQHEFSVRTALGGGSGRLFRQLFAESAVLVGLGSACGWLFALGATEVLRRWLETDHSLAPDATVLSWTLGVSAAIAIVFGLVPLRGAARSPQGMNLRSAGGSGVTARRRAGWSRRGVLVLQVAFGVVLVAGAGLLVRTMRNLQGVDLGLEARGLLVFGLSPQQNRSGGDSVQFFETVLARLREIPTVESATLMNNRIGSGWTNNTSVFVEGQSPLGENLAPLRWNTIGGDYFTTLQTPMLLGRDLETRDIQSGRQVAIVNETFAERYLADQYPLGKGISLGRMGNRFEIVGVAADSKYQGVREERMPMAYFPYSELSSDSAHHIELRTRGDAIDTLPLAARVVHELAPELPLMAPMTQQSQFAETYAAERMFAQLAMSFGLLAVILIGTGLYGALAYAVSRRSSELGIRMALGARRGQIIGMVLRETGVICAIGMLIGLPSARAAARLIDSMLFNVAPGDPLTFAAALLGIVMAALAASLMPAIRAASINPATTLRAE